MEAHSPQPSVAPPSSRRLPGPVLLLAVALALFLAGGATATALGFAARSPVDHCASVAEGVGTDGVNLAGYHLTGSMLAGAELCGADLRGNHLSNRPVYEVCASREPNLTGAVLTGADMTGAKTSGAAGLPEDLPQAESACDHS